MYVQVQCEYGESYGFRVADVEAHAVAQQYERRDDNECVICGKHAAHLGYYTAIFR